MSVYLLINILIIFVPLILSFEKKIAFYKKWKYLFLSLSVVSTGYIIWDIYATSQGDWAFNILHTMPYRIGGLPIEEILFFITVPYSAIFIYETLSLYIPDKRINYSPAVSYVATLLLILTAIMFNSQYYTFTVLLFSAGFLILAELKMKPLLRSRNYWLFVTFMYLPFFVVNYLLTSIPVVLYSSNAIWGIRITTIPLEDFFYSFSMISFWLYFYLYFKKNLSSSK